VKDDNNKQKKGRPNNNQAQNKQVNDAATMVTLSTDRVLRERFGRIVEKRSREQGDNLGFPELLELAEKIKSREIY
jgi:hypothetical protein